MKKIIRVGTVDSLQAKASANEVFIASRMGEQAWIQNVELQGASVAFDGRALVITIPLRDGEFVSLGDHEGVADKRFV